jgi:probable addiction module antidote protein
MIKQDHSADTGAVRRFDAAEYLDTPEAQEEFLIAAFEDGDPAHIARALGVVARAQGMARIARDAGLRREHLYKALSEAGNPRLDTLLAVAGALGFRISIRAVSSDSAQ